MEQKCSSGYSFSVSCPRFQWSSLFPVLVPAPEDKHSRCVANGSYMILVFLHIYASSDPLCLRKCGIIFGFFFASDFGFVFCFLSWCHLPCICNSLQRYLLHFGMETLHFALYLLHLALAMFAFHCARMCIVFIIFWHSNCSFAWYLLHFGASNVHVALPKIV